MTNYFPPEIGAAAHLYYDLAVALCRRGHDVAVLTGTPRYNIQDRHLALQQMAQLDRSAPFEVFRVDLRAVERGSKLHRATEHLEVPWRLARSARPGADAIIVYSPPLTLGLTGLYLSSRLRASVILNVQDLFPKEAVDTGIIKNWLLVHALQWLERYIYTHVHRITVHSWGNADHVARVVGDSTRVRVIPNWVNTEEITPGPRNNEFRRQMGFGQKDYIVSFAGTLGYFQDMDVILEAADVLRDDKSIRFLIVGDGIKKEPLIRAARNRRLENITFLPMQPKHVYLQVLAASDLSLVTLTPKLLTPVVPSKLLNIMAAGRPVVAAVPDTSDARRIINEANCGVVVPAGDGRALATAIASIKAQPETADRMGTAGRRYIEAHFSVDSAAAAYEKLIEELRASEERSKRG